jgi:adenine-specific DNA-methyltransferase
VKPIIADDPLARSGDIVSGNIEQLNALFPDAFIEGKIDFDVLRQLLGGTVDNGEEKYGLNWHGKRQARRLALTPSNGTLRPCPEESMDWSTTQNLMIEGDNLEVLKLLQKSYAGKVKLIYIDPPYNTGKDFVYPDNYQDNIKNYLELTGQVESGARLSSNTEASGRYHTDWLNMMYPRLLAARALLRNDGAVFISIDDSEQPELRLMCDDVFGGENFVATIVWQKTYSAANNKQGVDAMHDYVLAYGRSDSFVTRLFPRTEKQDEAYTNPDNDPRGVWKAVDATRGEHRDYAFFALTTPAGKEVFPAQGRSWVFTKEELPNLKADNRLWFGKDGTNKPSLKLFLTEVKQGLVPTTWWTHADAGHNDEAKKELKALFPERVPFETPKPTRLIRRIATLATSGDEEAIVLDFFAGSGTTGDAILQQNAGDAGNRRHIAVQLQEPTDQEDYRTISDLTKERLRRAAKRIKAENPMFAGDLGFRVFKLDSSNIRTWEPDRNDLAGTLDESVNHLKSGRSEGDVLYEVLLKLGLDLCVPIEQKTMAGKTVHSVGGGALFACLAPEIGSREVDEIGRGISEWHKALAPADPDKTQVVFRDSAFADDVAKTNITAILEQHGLTNVRSL